MKVLVNAVDKTSSIRQVVGATIGPMRVNERSSARFQFAPGYVPDRFFEVLAYAQDNTTLIYGGVVLTRSGTSVYPRSKTTVTDVDCVDWWFYADVAEPTSRVYAAPVTLKTILTDLVADCLTGYGITLDAGQVNGPTFAAFAWNNTRPSEALRMLSTWSSSGSTNYVARISPAKALKMFVSGTDAAPYSITDAASHCEELTWADPNFLPYTKVILWCGPDGPISYTQTWTQAGAATSWVADIPAQDWTNAGYVTVGGVFKTVSRVGEGAMYEWDDTTRTLYLGSDPAGTPANGTVLTFVYSAASPFRVTSGSGSIVSVNSAPSILSKSEGQTTADGLLVTLNQSPRTLSVRSAQIGWLPGQALTVALTSPTVSNTFTISEVTIELTYTASWRYAFVATESAVYQGGANDQWRALGVGTGASGGTVSSSVSAPAQVGIVSDLLVTDAVDGDMVRLGRIDAGGLALIGLDIWPDAPASGGPSPHNWFMGSGSVSAGPALVIADNDAATSGNDRVLCIVWAYGSTRYEIRKNAALNPVWLGSLAEYFDGAYIDELNVRKVRNGFGDWGTWYAVAYSAGDFTANGSMGWGVDAGDVQRRFTVIDHTLVYNVVISLSDVTGTASDELRVALPPGLTVTTVAYGVVYHSDAGAALATGIWRANPGESFIRISPTLAAGNWTLTSSDNTLVVFTATLEVSW